MPSDTPPEAVVFTGTVSDTVVSFTPEGGPVVQKVPDQWLLDVPARDMTSEEVAALPPQARADLDAHLKDPEGLYDPATASAAPEAAATPSAAPGAPQAPSGTTPAAPSPPAGSGGQPAPTPAA